MSNFVVNPYRFVTGGGYTSTADTNAMVCGGTNNPWTALNVSQFWDGDVWDNSVGALPVATQFFSAGGNYDNYLGAGGDVGSTDTATKDTFQWDGNAWTSCSGVPCVYPQTDSVHNGGCAFGGNIDSAFIHSGDDTDVSPTAYITSSGRWTGDAWVESVASTYGGQGRCGGGLPDDFIATSGYGYNGTGTLHYGYKTESFNGDSWTNEIDFPNTGAGGTSAFAYGGGCASGRESFLAFCSSQLLVNVAFIFDGTSWTGAGTLAESSQYGFGGGDSSNGIFAGGIVPGEPSPEPWGGTKSQIYNGTSFTSTADLDTGFTAGGGGANSS